MKIIKIDIANLSDKEKNLYHTTIALELISKSKKKYIKIISGTGENDVKSLFNACKNLNTFQKEIQKM